MKDGRIFKLCVITSIWLILSTLLGPPEFSYWNSFLQSCFLLFWSYAGHIFAHKVSKYYPINMINTHVALHHNAELKSQYPKWVDLSFEALNNFMGFFVLYIFQWLFGIHILSLKLILFAAFLYIGIHIFSYSLNNSKYHAEHHITPETNYSPEIFDILFHTKKEGPYEDISFKEELLPAVVAFVFIYFGSKWMESDFYLAK